jgi:uncharacterized protein (TIGR02271 family)
VRWCTLRADRVYNLCVDVLWNTGTRFMQRVYRVVCGLGSTAGASGCEVDTLRLGGTKHGTRRAQRQVHRERGGDLTDEDELRVQRTEEELRAGTREREAGQVSVRKRVRTDRERMEVPTRREEVTVERVPVSEETAIEAEIGEDEVQVPVTEEEVRIRKDVVEDTEVVEEDVRREEVDIDDQTPRRRDI